VAKRSKKQSKEIKPVEQYLTSAGAWVKTPKPEQPPMVQTVTLEFEDGTKGTFSGPAVIFDTVKEVTQITFTSPKPLPEGCRWDTM
jgi:hypothetical protein